MKVSVVIPNWNGAEKLRRNLPQALKVEGADEVIVSDDASTDNSLQVLKEFPDVKVVQRNKNGGFSSNVNTGVRHARGELVFLLNSDATPQKDSLKPALAHFEDPKVFSVGCNTGGSWAWAKFEKGFFWHRMAKDTPSQTHQTLWVSGGSGIFRKAIWDGLGGMDELFNPFYEEDVDLGYRAVKRGYINLWEPKSLVSHYREPGVIASHFSPRRISQTAQRNQLLFIWKNITSEKMSREHKRALVKHLAVHPRYWLVLLAAAKRLPKLLPKREIEKKEAKLTDEEILEGRDWSNWSD